MTTMTVLLSGRVLFAHRTPRGWQISLNRDAANFVAFDAPCRSLQRAIAKAAAHLAYDRQLAEVA